MELNGENRCYELGKGSFGVVTLDAHNQQYSCPLDTKCIYTTKTSVPDTRIDKPNRMTPFMKQDEVDFDTISRISSANPKAITMITTPFDTKPTYGAGRQS